MNFKGGLSYNRIEDFEHDCDRTLQIRVDEYFNYVKELLINISDNDTRRNL